RDALERLLAGTRLSAEEQTPGVVIVQERPAAPRPSTSSPPAADVPAPPEAAASSASELQEVVITAQRRAERLQDVPISVSVYDQATMDSQGVRAIDDVSRITPGLSFVHGANNNNSESSDIAIRGIASNAGAATTGVYIDDTPIQGRHLSFP